MKHVRLAIVLVVAILPLISCKTAAKPASPTARPSATSPSRAAATATSVAKVTPTAEPASSPGSGVDTATILANAAASRGLEVKGEVPFATLSRDEVRPYLLETFEKEHGKEDMEKAKALWVILDLMGEKDDLFDIWLGLLSEQIGGFYELDKRSMTLIGGSGPLSKADELTLAHEYVHALQDQHFGVGDLMKRVKKDGEKSLALRALIEGDATLAMVDYALKNMSRDDIASLQNEASNLDAQKLRSAPLVLQINLLFPYQLGASFVGSMFSSGGWTAVNKAYANPPTTSEQIIHPEKYTAGEGPQPVELPDIAATLGGEWSQLDNGTLGELGWLIYLANGLDPQGAASAAAGWGGDRYVLFRSRTGKLALVVLSVWDNDDEADELFYSTWDLQDTHTTTTYSLEEDKRFAWTRNATSGYASIKGPQVLLVITSDEATTKKIVGKFSGF